MSHAYQEFPLADRDASSPIDFPFWDRWRKRWLMHRQRPAILLPVSLTGLGPGPASGSTQTEIWLPPWARRYSAAFRIQATATVGFGAPAVMYVRLHLGAAVVERAYVMTQVSPGFDVTERFDVDLVESELDSNVTWKVSYELGANVNGGAAIETVVGSGRRLAQYWGTP